MNVGKAIYYLLSNAQSVTDIAGTRIYPELAEQEAVAPYAVYQIVSVNPDDTNDGPAVIDEVAMDILCVAESYNEAADLASAVRSALDRVRGTYNGVNVESIQYDSTDSDVQDSPRRYEQTVTLTVRVFRDAAQIATGQNIDQLTLGRLYDVTDDATTGQVIIKQADGTWAGGDAAATLGDLTDVTIDDPQDREALVYDQDTDTWINGSSTKLAIRVINQTGGTLYAGSPVKASGVQGDQVSVTIYRATQDPKLFIGLLSADIENGGTGYAQQTGTIYHLNTSAFDVGDILYPAESALALDNGLDYMTTTPPGSSSNAPAAKIPAAIVLRKHANTGRVYVRTWSPDSKLEELANVYAPSKNAGDALVWNGTQWTAGAVLSPAMYDLRDVFDYSVGTPSGGSILVWDAVNGYWFPQPKISFLPDTSVYYLGQYDTEAGTGRTAASTASITVERYLTIQGNGEGESISAQSDTPSSGNKIVRKIWHKANSFEQSDVDTWTLVHTFADDTAYADTEATFEALLNAQTYGTPPFTLAQSWEDVPAFTGLLDDYPGAAAAYSLRLLDSTYTGNAINVRRASDNAVQDIGFDANGDLDTSALATFCAGTGGYVVRWYDQSGNGNNATQATTSKQPQIYNSVSGVVTENGSPAVQFDGSDDVLSIADFAYSTSVVNVYLTFGSAAPNGIFGHYFTTNNERSWFVRGLFGYFGYNISPDGVNFLQTDSNIATTANQTLHTFEFKGSESGYDRTKGFVNGVQLTYQLYSNVGGVIEPPSSVKDSTEPLSIGAMQDGALHTSMKMQEIVMYASDQSANRTAIESNINTYYSIY